MLGQPLKVINVGVEHFHRSLQAQGVESAWVNWRPPLDGRPDRFGAACDEARARVAAANREAVGRILAGDPIWEDVRPAIEVVPGLTADTVLHAGPPIEWAQMAGPMRGAIAAALMYERRAGSPEEAMELAASGAIHFAPCHEHQTVGAMAGVISPSMPVFVVRNRSYNNLAFCAWRDLAQASGCFDGPTLDSMRWLRDVGMPAMRAAVRAMGGLELRPLWARALTMGDELHNRVSAGTSIFARQIAPHLVRAAGSDAAAQVLDYLAGFDLAIVPLTMAGCKAVLDAAHGVEGSSVVTAIARGGVLVGIRVSGLGDRWFTGPAGVVKGTYHPGFSEADACPDMGDSAIIETAGFGGMAIAAAPTHVTVKDEPGAAARYTREMYEIALARNGSYPIPTLGFQGVPAGIDLLRVMRTGILPLVDTPVAHKEPGRVRGVIGFGMSRPPAECFIAACDAFAEEYLT